MDENGILHMQMHEGMHLDYEDALDNYLVIRNLTGNRPALKLVDARGGFSIDAKAADFIRSKEVAENTIARAVLKSSFVSRLLSGFFSKLNSPKVPTRIFSDYDEAYEWLMSFRKTNEDGL